jgi:arylsulfatase A-like enzyme
VGARVADTVGTHNHVAVVNAATASANSNLPNIILIVADALRAQTLSVYGYPDNITPSIDRFAQVSSTYLAMHTNATTTIPSVLTLLTGRHPLSHGRLNREIPPRPESLNLLSLLSRHGYSIGAVTSHEDASHALESVRPGLKIAEELAFGDHLFSWLSRVGIFPTRFSGRMYEDFVRMVPFIAFSRRVSWDGNVNETMMRANRLMLRLPAPFFLLVHIREPHAPYELPGDFKAFPHSIDGSQLKPYAPYAPVLQPAVDVYRRLYEMTVQAMDTVLGKFLEEVSRSNDNLIILTSDHGESFKHGYFLHGEELYENSTWVPLLIRHPGQTKGDRVGRLTQSTDIAPTILNAVGIPKPDWMEGQSLSPGVLPAPTETVAINYKGPNDGVVHRLPTKIAIWWDRYKLIAVCQTGKAELYDLTQDPQEQTDISQRATGMAEDLERRLRARLANQSAEPRLSCPNL